MIKSADDCERSSRSAGVRKQLLPLLSSGKRVFNNKFPYLFQYHAVLCSSIESRDGLLFEKEVDKSDAVPSRPKMTTGGSPFCVTAHQNVLMN